MNGVFFKLKTEFQPDENYTGKDIIKEILETIRVSPRGLCFTNKSCFTDKVCLYALMCRMLAWAERKNFGLALSKIIVFECILDAVAALI